MKLIYGLVFMLLLLGTGVGLFIYSRKEKSKIGQIISVLILSLVTLLLLTNTIDELSISKKDIITDLAHINIELKDDFEIIRNRVTGMPERIQETEIQISKKDKDRIIQEIEHSANFQSFVNGQKLINDNEAEQFAPNDKVFNFKYPEHYSRQTFTKIDNYPARLLLSIYENTNTIRYQRFEN